MLFRERRMASTKILAPNGLYKRLAITIQRTSIHQIQERFKRPVLGAGEVPIIG